MSVLKNVQPENVFHFFEEICNIPHGSYHTKEISDYLVNFAKERGFEHYQDDANNVVIIKEATKGYESSEPVILQGHIDMVCEKEEDVDINFETDGLELYVDGDFVKAKGTTLGADDGIAVAFSLALLDSSTFEHPRLEVVLTADEEVGLLGAQAIELPMLKGHFLLNIDSDVEGHFLTSCAGGMTVHVKLPLERTAISGREYVIKLHHLCGGHSGSEIDKERANAIIEMGRVLKCLDDRIPLGIRSLAGGLKDNAIPRETSAIIIVPLDHETELEKIVPEIEEILKKEYAVSDPDLTLTLEKKETITADILTAVSMQKVLFYLRNVPNGCIHMSTNMKGLVETSLNAGILNLSDNECYICGSVRSSVSSRKEDLLAKITFLTEYLGGTVEVMGDYAAWEYRPESILREKASAVYTAMFGTEPVFEAIHAGLECGILSAKIANLDAVSFGPDNFDIHTPQERLSISSTERVFSFVTEFLRSMK